MANAGKGRLGVTGLRTDHYERHVDFHVKMHLEDAIKGLDSFVEREKIGRVIIGGSDEAAAEARAMLHHTIREKVIGTAKVEMFADANAVLAATTPIVEAYEKKQEGETVEYLITQALSGGNAVLGMADVITALQERRVMRLIMVKDFRADGYVCGACGFLNAQKVETCPACGGEMKHIDYMADLAGELAVQQGAVAEVVSESKRLAEYGGIGALLRF
jgi:peptide chain release factor subunit 1